MISSIAAVLASVMGAAICLAFSREIRWAAPGFLLGGGLTFLDRLDSPWWNTWGVPLAIIVLTTIGTILNVLIALPRPATDRIGALLG